VAADPLSADTSVVAGGDSSGPPAPGTPPQLTRVRKAYEQVYDQLRDLIMRGELARGERLPGEVVLARQFGVSRGTVREALRALAAHNLVRTAKGASGGTFVTLPTVDHISAFMQANISLLSEANDVTLEEFLEARRLLEVFAARQCAQRRHEADLDRLRATVIRAGTHPPDEQFLYNKEFHSVLVDGAGNTLLRIAAQPIFSVLQTNLSRDRLSSTFSEHIEHDHRAILAAIECGDGDAAAAEMDRHLDFLSRTYTSMWRSRPGP
jgi:GntR family transcriptional regulator, transcriptional repressor for pyruvate dehydrogenase complex